MCGDAHWRTCHSLFLHRIASGQAENRHVALNFIILFGSWTSCTVFEICHMVRTELQILAWERASSYYLIVGSWSCCFMEFCLACLYTLNLIVCVWIIYLTIRRRTIIFLIDDTFISISRPGCWFKGFSSQRVTERIDPFLSSVSLRFFAMILILTLVQFTILSGMPNDEEQTPAATLLLLQPHCVLLIWE